MATTFKSSKTAGTPVSGCASTPAFTTEDWIV